MIKVPCSELITELFSLQNYEKKLHCLFSMLKVSGTFENVNLSYFIFNKIDNKLENSQYDISIKLLDSSNPLVYSFLMKKSYLIESILIYPDLAKCLSGGSNEVFLIPLENFGVLALYGSNESLDDKKKQNLAKEIGSIFLSSEKVNCQYKKSSDEISKNHQEVKLLQSRDNNLLKKSYLNHTWIDFSGINKSFKRDILFYVETNRVLNIIGLNGSGKSYLASVIQQLRNAYGDNQNFVDLANVNDVEQLNSIFGINYKKINYFDYRYDKTLILKNFNALPSHLINHLYDLLSHNEDIKKNEVKIILTSLSKSLHESCSNEVISFFNQEVLSIHNRIDHLDNFSAFTESFIKEYYKENLKIIKGITEGALITLKASPLINSLDKLKQYIFAICEITPNEKQIDQHKVKRVLENTNLAKNIGLSEQVAQYEKSLILKTFALNNWNQEETARQFNLPRRTFGYKCAKHNIKGKYAK